MSRVEEKVSAQRRLIAAGNGAGDNGRSEEKDADEAQLEKLRQRQDPRACMDPAEILHR